MGFKGSLDSINLADIFQNLALNQQTGTLKITSGNATRYVYFKDGAVRLFSRDKRRGNRLGEMVVGRGLATLEQVESALEKQQETGQLLGEILVQNGILSREDIHNLIRYQIEEDVYETFFLKGGDFEFIDGDPLPDVFDPEQEAVEININTPSLIMEAARRLDEWDRMKEQIPSTNEIFLPQPALLEMAEKGELEPLEARILDFLDGGRDVNDIVEESSFSRFEVMSTLVGFLERGLIRSATLDDLSEAAEMCRREGRLRHVIKIYERMLAKGIDTPELRANLAEAAANLEEHDKAAIHYGVLAQHYLEEGNEDHAITILQKIVKIIPKHVPSRTMLAEIFASRGEVEKALPHYVTLVQTLFETGRLPEAERYAIDALSLDPENLDVLQFLSRIHIARKEPSKAAETLVKMGRVLSNSGKTRAAEEIYRKAALLDPTNEEAKAELQSLEERLRATKARPVLGALILLFLLFALVSGVLVGLNELYSGVMLVKATERFQKTGDTSNLFAALSHPSITTDPTPAIKTLVDKGLAEEKAVLLAKLGREREQKELAGILRRGQALFRRHRLEEAKKVLSPLARRNDFREIASEASQTLEAIQAIEEDFREYREWLRQNEGNPATLREEYERKKAFAAKYPWSKEAGEMRLPLLIKTQPPGADVYVGGKFASPSPYLLYYKPGERLEVEIRKQGFGAKSRTLVNPSADEVVITFALGRIPKWSADVGGTVEIPPVIVEDKIIVPDRAGRLVAFERSTGRKMWEYVVSPTGLGDVSSPITYYGGRMFFGSGDAHLRAVLLHPGGAKEAWNISTPGKILSTCAVRRLELLNGDLFVFAADVSGNVFCLGADTGQPVWTKKLGTRVEAPLGITDRLLYVPDTSGTVTALDVVTGEVKWRSNLRAPISGLISIKGTFIASAGNQVFSFAWDTRPDTPEWTYLLGGLAVGPPSMAGNRCYAGDAGKKLHCINLVSGKPVWVPPAELDSRLVPPVAGGADTTYAVSSKGTLYAFDASGKGLRWKYEFRKPVAAGCAYAEGAVYVVTRAGSVYAFEDIEE